MFVCILDASGNVRVHQNIHKVMGSDLLIDILAL
jgi:hypothetical protein